MFDDGQAEARTPVGPAPAVVDPVEALEDPLELRRRDADAAVGDGDLDVVVVAHRVDVGGDHDPGPGIGVDDRVLDQVADRDPELPGAAQHQGAGRARHGQGDLVLARHPPGAGRPHPFSTSSMSTTSGSTSGLSDWSRDRSMIWRPDR